MRVWLDAECDVPLPPRLCRRALRRAQRRRARAERCPPLLPCLGSGGDAGAAHLVRVRVRVRVRVLVRTWFRGRARARGGDGNRARRTASLVSGFSKRRRTRAISPSQLATLGRVGVRVRMRVRVRVRERVRVRVCGSP